jgi:hypothetical protein
MRVLLNPSGSTNHRSQFNIAQGLILLVALLTRIWRLGYHSLWLDEAISLKWATSAPADTWRVTFALVEEKHPPVYYLFLHGWRETLRLFGLEHSDAGLRLSGALLGVLTVWGLMLLVRQVSASMAMGADAPNPQGERTALLAGLLLAISPVFVWYSQELRMFQPAATGVVWAAYFLLRGWQGATWMTRTGWWVGFALALLASLYSYLFSAFVLPAAGLTLIVLALSALHAETASLSHNGAIPPSFVRSSSFGRFCEGVLALAVVTLLFLPLAYNAWVVNGSEGAPGRAFMDFGAVLLRQLRVMTIWRADWPEWLRIVASVLFGGLALIGLLLPARRSGAEQPAPQSLADQSPISNPQSPIPSRLFLWLWLGVPLIVGGVLLTTSDSIFGEDRYFLFVGPFALWAIARGAVVLTSWWRPAGWVATVMAVLLLLAALPILWTPAMQRENWRAAVRYIDDYQHASPGLPGAMVAHVDYTRYAVAPYLRQGEGNGLALFHPFAGVLSADQVETVVAPALAGIADDGAATLWLLQSHLDGVDDQRLVEGWLNQNYPLVTEQYPSGVKLTGHALTSFFASQPPLAPNAVQPQAELVSGLTLAACEIITPQVQASDDQMHPPSGWVHVRLWWQKTGEIADDYIATVQMIGPEGVWGDRLYRANEATAPLADTRVDGQPVCARRDRRQPQPDHTDG